MCRLASISILDICFGFKDHRVGATACELTPIAGVPRGNAGNMTQRCSECATQHGTTILRPVPWILQHTVKPVTYSRKGNRPGIHTFDNLPVI